MTTFTPTLLQILRKVVEQKQMTDLTIVSLASAQVLVETNLRNATARSSAQEHASEILDSFVTIIEKFSGRDAAKSCVGTLCILVINFFDELPGPAVLRHMKSILRTMNVLYSNIFRTLSLDDGSASSINIGIMTAALACVCSLALVVSPLLHHTSPLVVPQDQRAKFREIILQFVTKDSINRFGVILSKLKKAVAAASTTAVDEDKHSTTLLQICKLLTVVTQIDEIESDTTRSLATRVFSNASLCSHLVEQAGISYILMHNIIMCEVKNSQPTTIKFLEKYLATYMDSLENFFGYLEKDVLDKSTHEAALKSYNNFSMLVVNILGTLQYHPHLQQYMWDSVLRGFLYRVGKFGALHLDDQSLVIHGFGIFLLAKHDYEARTDEKSREESSKLIELIKTRMKKLKMDVDIQEGTGGGERLARQLHQLMDKCEFCNKDGTQLLLETGHRLKQCSRCLRAHYCRKAWPSHKLVCVPATQQPTGEEFAARWNSRASK